MEHLSNLRHAQILRSSSAPYRATFAPNLEQPSSSASNTQNQHVKSQATALITSHLKQELATILSASPLSKCLKDQAFAAVIRHAIAQTQETVAHVRTLPPPAVTAEIIDAIVLKATQETTEYANSMAAAAHEVPVEKFRIHLNPRTFQPLKRDVRDRDRGQFFSVLNGLLANYIKRECQLEDHRAHRAHKNNGLGGGGRPVSDSRKKRFRRGKRAQQLSDLVTRAVRDDSLTDALVAVKALLCQATSGGGGSSRGAGTTSKTTNALQQSAVNALVHLGERFVPDVGALRKKVMHSWLKHRTSSWQSDPTLMFAWQGPSRTHCEVRRVAQTHTYVLKGSNFVARGMGMCTSGMGHVYYEVDVTSVLQAKGLRVGWGSNSRALAPDTYSTWNHGPNEMYPSVWASLGYKSASSTLSSSSSRGGSNDALKHELGSAPMQWGLDLHSKTMYVCGKPVPLRWTVLPGASSSGGGNSGGNESNEGSKEGTATLKRTKRLSKKKTDSKKSSSSSSSSSAAGRKSAEPAFSSSFGAARKSEPAFGSASFSSSSGTAATATTATKGGETVGTVGFVSSRTSSSTKSTLSTLPTTACVGCHYDTDEQTIWFTIGAMRSEVIHLEKEETTELELARLGTFLVPMITCNAYIGRSSVNPPLAMFVTLGDSSFNEHNSENTTGSTSANQYVDLHQNISLIKGYGPAVHAPGRAKNIQTEAAALKTRPNNAGVLFMCTCENGVAYRNSPAVSDRWDQMRGAAEFQIVQPKGIYLDDKDTPWLMIELPYFGIKYFPMHLESGSRPLFRRVASLHRFHRSRHTPMGLSHNGSGGGGGGAVYASDHFKRRNGVAVARCVSGVSCGQNGGTRIVFGAAVHTGNMGSGMGGGGGDGRHWDVKHIRTLHYELRVRMPEELCTHERHVLLCRGEQRSKTQNSKSGGYDLGVTSKGKLYVLVHTNTGGGSGGGNLGDGNLLHQTVPGVVKKGGMYHLMVHLTASPVSVSFYVDGVLVKNDAATEASSVTGVTGMTGMTGMTGSEGAVSIRGTDSPLILGGRNLHVHHVLPTLKLPGRSAAAQGDDAPTVTIRVKEQSSGEETFFKLKMTTKMGKVFKAYASRIGMSESSLRYVVLSDSVG
jgi:hypothetical protein